MRPEWHGVRRILAVRLDNIGDLVMLGPALRTIRAAFPAAHLALLCSPAGATVAPMLSEVDEVIVERVVWQDASAALPLDPARELALVDRLRAGAFDAAIIFTSFSQSPWPPAYACYLAAIPIRVARSREFGGSLLTHPVRPIPDATHQVDRNLDLLAAAGFRPVEPRLALAVPPAARARAGRALRAVGVDAARRFMVVAPGASCAARQYPVERFAAVAAGLAGRTGDPVVLVGSAAERHLEEAFRDHAGRGGPGAAIVSLIGRTSVAELAAILERSALLVTNDSGPMHIADAVGTPQVVCFSGTELERQWRPRGAPAVLLRRATSCSPCHRFDCPIGLPCLDIPAEEVVEAALSLKARAAGRLPQPADRAASPGSPSPIRPVPPAGPPLATPPVRPSSASLLPARPAPNARRTHPTDARHAAPAPDPHLARSRELPVLPGAGGP